MATQAYRDWVSAGRPFTIARPIRELRDMARAAGVEWLGDIGDDGHLTASRPEDHTPFSATAWPVPLPGYVVTAGDLANGPWMDRMLDDARAGRAPWIKYLNYGGHHYNRKRGFAQESSSDQHGHVSIMSDHIDASIGSNPFTAPTGPAAPAWPGRTFILRSPQMTGSDIRQWQQRMHDRGWTIGVDGMYGPESKSKCLAFQREKGLRVDGEVGPITWAATWTAPVT